MIRTRVFAVGVLLSASVFGDSIQQFTAGDLVVSVEGNGSGTGNYTDNQAAPLTLYEFGISGTSTPAVLAGTLELPQTTVAGGNYAVSGEYGSSSEGTLQLSGDGKYLTIMGYGVNSTMFNANPAQYGAVGTIALGQSGNLTGPTYTAVPRVVALIDASGNVNSTTAVYNAFNTNNPRSAYTANGTTVYISGQGSGSDATAGVFFTTVGTTNNAATPITGLDTTNNTISQDTRDVQIYNGQLYVSADTKGGSNSARSYIGTLGTGTPTTTVGGPAMLPGFGNTGGTGKVTISNNGNGINTNGQVINLSPQNYFFANATTLYVADDGAPKNDSASSKTNPGVGDGGLQKWTFNGTTWILDYTLSAGLNLVENMGALSTDTSGTTGLYGLTGEVVGNQVELFATNYTIGDLDQTYLYGITDTLGDTTAAQVTSEVFQQLAIAPADTNFKGVSFAPTASSVSQSATPEPASFALFALGLGALFTIRRRYCSAN